MGHQVDEETLCQHGQQDDMIHSAHLQAKLYYSAPYMQNVNRLQGNSIFVFQILMRQKCTLTFASHFI